MGTDDLVVYVVERDIYESTYIQGVYRTLEDAQAACPVKEWREMSEDVWANGLDFADCAYIFRFVVEP